MENFTLGHDYFSLHAFVFVVLNFVARHSLLKFYIMSSHNYNWCL